MRVIHERARVIKPQLGKILFCVQQLEARFRKGLTVRRKMMVRVRRPVIRQETARKQGVVPPADLLRKEQPARPEHAEELIVPVFAAAGDGDIERILRKRERFLRRVAFLHADAEGGEHVAVVLRIRPPGLRNSRVFIWVAQRKQEIAARVYLKKLIRPAKPALHLRVKVPRQRLAFPPAVQMAEIPAAEREFFLKTPKIIQLVAGHIKNPSPAMSAIRRCAAAVQPSFARPNARRRSVSSRPSSTAISIAPPGVTCLPAIAMRTGQSSVPFFMPCSAAMPSRSV